MAELPGKPERTSRERYTVDQIKQQIALGVVSEHVVVDMVAHYDAMQQERDEAITAHRAVSYVCHDQADALKAAEATVARCKALAREWRERAKTDDAFNGFADEEIVRCADQLEAALTESPTQAPEDGR